MLIVHVSFSRRPVFVHWITSSRETLVCPSTGYNISGHSWDQPAAVWSIMRMHSHILYDFIAEGGLNYELIPNTGIIRDQLPGRSVLVKRK